MSLLERILETKRREIAELRLQRSSSAWENEALSLPAPRDFPGALRNPGISVIAEIKRASPSRGRLKSDSDPLALAQEYERGGAAALSVVTDREFFQGDPSFLREISSRSRIPVLRKDFVLDEVQVYETRVLGADAVLLIVRILSDEQLSHLHSIAIRVGLSTLVETHDEEDIRRAMKIGATLIGVNNRDLNDFSVSLERSIRLRPLLADNCITVSESGIRTREDALRLRRAGYDAILMGEGLVEHPDRVEALRTIVSA